MTKEDKIVNITGAILTGIFAAGRGQIPSPNNFPSNDVNKVIDLAESIIEEISNRRYTDGVELNPNLKVEGLINRDDPDFKSEVVDSTEDEEQN
ncbi:hypothetical protein LCGC14_3087410 [marine sediment metagenome]|uniref:Uncharacterized protein n=1 Tax=marine sediment metagenome TaxID=412755 RepID=A0A0F8YJ17_9ZZZZ